MTKYPNIDGMMILSPVGAAEWVQAAGTILVLPGALPDCEGQIISYGCWR